MMKILCCLIVLALCACRAYSFPTGRSVPCTLVEDGLYFFSIRNISFASLKRIDLLTPDDPICTSSKCVQLYYDGLVKLQRNMSGLEKLLKVLKTINLKGREGTEENNPEENNPKTFFEKLKRFLLNLGRNCK